MPRTARASLGGICYHVINRGRRHWRTNGPLNGIDPGPEPRPEPWIESVNQPLSAAELDQIKHSVNRGTPYGLAGWVSRVAAQLGLNASLRPRGRPRKEMEM